MSPTGQGNCRRTTGKETYSEFENDGYFYSGFSAYDPMQGSKNPYAVAVASKNTKWSRKECAKPRIFVQSALFSAQRLFSDAGIINKEIASSKNFTVKLRGHYLDQCCLDIWSELFYRCQNDFSEKYEFNVKDLLKTLNKGSGGKSNDWLINRIKLLSCSYINIIYTKPLKGAHYSGPLLTARYFEMSESIEVVFDERIIELFDETGFSVCDSKVRHGLKKNLMAKFIYEYVLSRSPKEKPQMISLTTLRSYAWPLKRKDQAKESFKRAVNSAIKTLNEIEDITFTLKLIKSTTSKDFNLVFSKKAQAIIA
ncbi:hypothetical protein [Methylobacter svalbardensis]|uniref:hypothetical protein n=1 Tax=Methylobacter svalbardensis TaxID=3080016 RepID=UPI0030EE88D3